MIRPARTVVLAAAAAGAAVAATAAATIAIAGAPAAAAAGGLTIEPAILQKTAVRGSVGSLTVVNSTPRSMRIAVTPRPWIQRGDGMTVPDVRRRLAGVRVTSGSFTLLPGQRRSIGVRLTGTPAARSLYGNIEVIGVPARQSRRGVAVRYRLISALRLDPPRSARRLGVAVGRVGLTGRGAARRLLVAVRNRGNTIAPVGGSVRIVGATGSLRSTVAATRILPGRTVALPAHAGRLPAGRYVARIALSQSGRQVANVRRGFVVR